MSKRRARAIAALIFTAIAVFCVLLFLGFHKDNHLPERTTVTVDGETTHILEASLCDLSPGNSREYYIDLDGDNADAYYVTLVFRDDDGGALKNYVDVEIVTDGTTQKKSLKSLLEGNEYFSLGKKASTIKIIYSMSNEVGNESQGTEVSFYIDLTTKRIKD